MTVSRRLVVARRTLPDQVAALLRDARRAMGWTQDELASRAGTSQTRIWRLERGDASAFDPGVVDDVLDALGVRLHLGAEARHLDDRVLQRDAVHARLLGAVADRLQRAGWQVLTEVPIGGDPPRGWIDLFGHRESDEAVAVGEVKTAITDAGGLQRQVAFYEREAVWAARRCGWQPRVIAAFVVALDTEAVAGAIGDNARLFRRAFPGTSTDLGHWLAEPGAPPPRGATLVVTDLARHRSMGLRAPASRARRRHGPAYADYADAASRLRRR